MKRIPRKLKKRLNSERFREQKIIEALKVVSLACGNAAFAMNDYMTAISSYKAVNHLREFNTPK